MEKQSPLSLISSPNPGELTIAFYPKQLAAFNSSATELLFGGASEGGKSFFGRCALAIFAAVVPNLQCFIYRKFYQDVISNHMFGEGSFPDLLSPWVKSGHVKITENQVNYPYNNSRITLGQLRTEEDCEKAQGVPKQAVLFDEATQMLERHIRTVRGWVRMSAEMKALLPKVLAPLFPGLSPEELRELLPRIFYTANPIGPSVPFFRKTFVDSRPEYAIEKVGAFTQQYIQSLITDNPSADPLAQRERLGSLNDEAIAEALITGRWDIMVGEYFPEWDEERHVVKDVTPPKHWFRFRALDLGYAEPFCVLWVAVSDGETFRDSEGYERWFPRGAYIVYNEWYGCDEKDPAKGIRMRNEDIAAGIVARSEPELRNIVTLTDSLPFQDRGGEFVPEVFRKNGCPLTLGDTSRVVGWNQLRSRLIGIKLDPRDADKDRVPMIYYTECCKASRDYIPALSRHPSESKKEDAAEHGEATHAADCSRLVAMSHTIIKDKLQPMESRIERALSDANRPTMKKLMGNNNVFA